MSAVLSIIGTGWIYECFEQCGLAGLAGSEQNVEVGVLQILLETGGDKLPNLHSFGL